MHISITPMVRGRRSSRLLTAMLLGLAALAGLPQGAAAGAHANIRKAPGESAAFTLAGSNGYSLYFKSEKGQLAVVVSRRRPSSATISPLGKLVPANSGAASESTYFLNTGRDPSKIDADLGALGQVSLTFQPSGEKKVTFVDLESKSEKCVGAAKVVRRLGSFVGTVNFRGENGYTSAEATSVPGTVGTSPFRNCTTLRGAAGDAPLPTAPPDAFLTATGAGSFLALHGPDETRFTALAADYLGDGLNVFRQATAIGGQSAFRLGRRRGASWANLSPPPPFSGTASYRHPQGAPPSWRGDLSVEFPGAVLPLTGGETDARLTFFPPERR
jgi:hypothetical protein